MNANVKAATPTAAAAAPVKAPTNAPVAAPTVAPTAAADPVADIKTMNATELRAFLNVLRNDEFDLADKELAANQKQQAAVVAQIRELKANRSTELTKIADAIKAQGFSVKELFSDDAIKLFTNEELLAEAKVRGISTGKVPKADGAAATPKAPKAPKAWESNDVLLIAPKGPTDTHHKDKDAVIRQGQVKVAGFSVNKPLLRVAGKDANETIANLMKLVQPESAEFAKSADGKAELERIAKYILKAKEKASAAA